MTDNNHLNALRAILATATPPSTVTGTARLSKSARLSEIERIAREAAGEENVEAWAAEDALKTRERKVEAK